MEKFKACHCERSEESELSGYSKFRFFVPLRSIQNDNFATASSLKLLFLFCTFFIFHPTSNILAQHTRLYACALGSDDPAAFMGGSSIGGGLQQSDDTGKTWKQLGWKHVKCFSVDVVNKSNGKIIYQACGNGVLRSTDAGATWTMITDWRMTEVMDVVVDQKAPKNIYIATPGAIWKSDDGGDNWYEADVDIPYPLFVSRIKIDPKDHLKIYAATDSGLYESRDGGIGWEQKIGDRAEFRDMTWDKNGTVISVGLQAGNSRKEKKDRKSYNDYVNLWSMLTVGDTIIVAGAEGIFYASADALPQSPKNVHSLVKIGNSLFAGSLNGGVWEYDIAKENAMCEVSGLEKMQVWRLKTVEVK